MKEVLLVSFSGGRTSAFMSYWLKNNMAAKYELIFVFANTGKEREETLSFVNQCDKHFGLNLIWVEAVFSDTKGVGTRAKVVEYHSASRNGEPFEELIKRSTIPNQNRPNCSRDLKRDAIRAYMKSIGKKKYLTAIGIRYDEPKRINWETATQNNIIYPLVTMIPMVRSGINEFWSNQSFDLDLKSYEGNCDLCWKKSFRKLMTIASENPQLTEWWLLMEAKYENHIGIGVKQPGNIKLPLKFFREQTSIRELIEDAQLPFDKAIDESKLIATKQPQLWDEHYDRNLGCIESCEAF